MSFSALGIEVTMEQYLCVVVGNDWLGDEICSGQNEPSKPNTKKPSTITLVGNKPRQE
jgi:hypothetical protein